MKNVFKCFGNVDRVYLHAKPTSSINEDGLNRKPSYFNESSSTTIKSFKVAYVIFSSPNALQKSIKKETDEVQVLSTKERPIQVGMKS